MFYKKIGKRIIDLLVSFTAILFLIPIFFIIAILIKIDSKGKVIFKHKRLGKDCKAIYVWKFRTMVENAINIGPEFTSLNDKRITKIGKMLRNTSLDELPQIINILKGDMSLIGPRPDAYTETPTSHQILRTKVLPGITGLAQVNGRSALTKEMREKYDESYIENYSFIFDVIILLKTIKVVIMKIGTN